MPANRSIRNMLRSVPLSQKLLLPMVVLTVLSAALTALVIFHQHRSFHVMVEERIHETVSSIRSQYEQLRGELVNLADILADNPEVENGLLIGEQFDVLNTASRYIGYSRTDMINIYDLDGFAFARGQRPSSFGDQDELSRFVLDMLADARNNGGTTAQTGILHYGARPTLIAARVVHGISGPAGVVVVGREISRDLLASMLVEERDVLSLTSGDSTLVTTTVANADHTGDTHSVERVLHETHINARDPLNLELFVDTQAQFSWFWKTPLGIIMVMATAALASVVITSLYVLHAVIRPIRHLISVAERQVSGNLSAKVRLRTRDELGRLGHILNQLTASLQRTLRQQQETIDEREKANLEVRRLNAELEQRVARRTAQLERELNERKRAQEELVRAKEEAEKANASKSRFLTAASHDLRQPVHAMSLMTENLAQKVSSDPLSEDVDNIALCLDSLREMFSKIFDIAKLDAGGIVPEMVSFPVAKVLDKVASEYKAVAGELELELRVVSSGTVIRSDPSLLYRILTNLVSNALENTKEGRVLVGCRRCKDGLSIQIWDTGVGIREEEMRLLFNEFYRAGESRRIERSTKIGPGIGLGLSIVEQVANLLEHSIEVVSTRGQMTMFAVHVPYGTSTPVEAPDQQLPAPEVVLENAAILVVDDNPMALRAIVETTRLWGCQVTVADSCKKAIRLLQSGAVDPDACVVDYLLERGETGIRLLQAANRLLGRKVPAVVLSGIYSQQMEHEARESGHVVLHKPVQGSQLRTALSECLRPPTEEPRITIVSANR